MRDESDRFSSRRELLAAVSSLSIAGCSKFGIADGDSENKKETTEGPDITQWDIVEHSFTTTKPYTNSQKYSKVVVDGVFTGPDGKVITVPGFWDGDDTFRVRFAPPEPGSWDWKTISNDSSLNGHSGSFTVTSPTTSQIETNPNYRGFLQTATTSDSRYFEYADGTPFRYAAGTSWDGNSDQFPFESAFRPWVDDRKVKEMTVLQVLVCEASNGYLGSRNAGINEGGSVFAGSKSTPNYSEIRPDNLQWFDKRIEYIHESGLVPNIYFEWSGQYDEMSRRELGKYYRYLVARYGAYNVIWTLSGEWNRETKDSQLVRKLGNYVDGIDGLDHLTTIHPWPGSTTADFVEDSWIDFHTHQSQDKNEVSMLEDDWGATSKPLVNSEPHVANNPDFEDGPAVRRDAWEILTSGRAAGMAHLYYPLAYDADSFNDITEQLDGTESQDVVRAFQYFNGFDWWKLVPGMDRVQSGQSDDASSRTVCSYLPDGSLELVYYSDNSDATVDLTPVDSASAEITWLRTADGTQRQEGTFDISTAQSLSPPSDWADALLIVQPA